MRAPSLDRIPIMNPKSQSIYQNKLNYMNYSQYKKNEQSVLLYGQDTNFRVSSGLGFGEVPKFVPIKPQNNEQKRADFTKIVMEGRSVPNQPRSHPR